MGMVKISTKPAPSRVLLDSPTAALSSAKRMRWSKKVASTTMHRMPPGRYSGSMVPDTFVFLLAYNTFFTVDGRPLYALGHEIVTAMPGRRNVVGEALEQQLVTMICKRAAIKAGQLLSPIEMQELVRQLEACEAPRTCPHGRPTMIQLSAGELEKAFGRS